MTDRQLLEDAGQMLLVGFHGTELPPDLRDRLQRGQVGGVVHFSRNLVDLDQVCALNGAILDAVAAPLPPPFIALDQEGGRVQRLREPLTRIPPMALVGDAADADLAARIGEVIGAELEALGFNLDFAPCADLRTNPQNNVIGDRSFGADPAQVARLAGAVAAGLTISGIIPCFKHFPGHGDTFADSHEQLPTVAHDIETLRRREIDVFARLLRTAAPMVMTAHLLIPAIDTHHPITLSEQGISQLLRRTLRYGGVVISDDLEMAAIADHHTPEEIATRGLRAGLDILLFCHSADRQQVAFETLVRLGEANPADRERIAMAAGRIRFLKQSYLRPWARPERPADHVGTPEHRAVVDKLLRRAGSIA